MTIDGKILRYAGNWTLHCNLYSCVFSLSYDMNVQFNFITHYSLPESFFQRVQYFLLLLSILSLQHIFQYVFAILNTVDVLFLLFICWVCALSRSLIALDYICCHRMVWWFNKRVVHLHRLLLNLDHINSKLDEWHDVSNTEYTIHLCLFNGGQSWYWCTQSLVTSDMHAHRMLSIFYSCTYAHTYNYLCGKSCFAWK